MSYRIGWGAYTGFTTLLKVCACVGLCCGSFITLYAMSVREPRSLISTQQDPRVCQDPANTYYKVLTAARAKDAQRSKSDPETASPVLRLDW